MRRRPRWVLWAVAIGLLIASRIRALDLAAPLDQYTMSSGFGLRSRSYMGGVVNLFHGGVDLVAPIGSPVRAAAAGTVVKVWPPKGTPRTGGGVYQGHPVFGGMIRIQHDDNMFTLYGHLSKIEVWEGWHVWAGREIGLLGSTGISTGPHLHFEVLIAPDFTPPPAPPDPVDEYMARAARAFLAREWEKRNATQ